MTATAVDTYFYTDEFYPSSTNVAYVCYDELTQSLFVTFHSDSNAYYQYGGVSRDVYEQFKSASSTGQFYAWNIKNKYTSGALVDGDNLVERSPSEQKTLAVAPMKRSLTVTVDLSGNFEEFVGEASALLDWLNDGGFSFSVTEA